MISGEPGSQCNLELQQCNLELQQCNLELQDASGINQTVTIDRMAGAGSCCPP
jgi:hypothetical protein